MEQSLLQHQTRATIGGAFAGIAGGMVMSGLWVFHSLLEGGDPWVHLKLAGAPYLGSPCLEPGFSLVPVLFGLSLHLAISLAWGLAFGIIAYGLPRLLTVAVGLLHGTTAFLFMHGLLLPLCGLRVIDRPASFETHALVHWGFGLAVALAFCVVQQPMSPDALRRLRHTNRRQPW